MANKTVILTSNNRNTVQQMQHSKRSIIAIKTKALDIQSN